MSATEEWKQLLADIEKLEEQQTAVDDQLYDLKITKRRHLEVLGPALVGRAFRYHDRYDPAYKVYDLVLEVDMKEEIEGEATILRVLIDSEKGHHEIKIMRCGLYLVNLDEEEVPLSQFQADVGWLLGELTVTAGL